MPCYKLIKKKLSRGLKAGDPDQKILRQTGYALIHRVDSCPESILLNLFSHI